LSQRYVPERDAAMVEPAVIAEDPELHKKFVEAAEASVRAYTELVDALEQRTQRDSDNRCRTCGGPVTYDVDPCGYWCSQCWRLLPANGVKLAPLDTAQRKRARQAARAVLPNATETRIVVTGNYRAWRHFIAMRATEHADVEI
ncbi:hypothetical protein E1091_19500, partial [Micromonospora fluostatini]